MSPAYMSRSYFIGSLTDDLEALAEVVWVKCMRASTKHESVVVLANDNGEVFVGMSGNSAALRTLNRNPRWLVGRYSMVNAHNIDCMPKPSEIAEDLAVRCCEVMTKRAA